MSKKKEERHLKIRQILMDHQEMKVSALAQMLQVTPETMRKDLDELENQNLIVREHGSAFLKSAISQLPVKIRSQEFPDEKRRITMRAIREIQNGNIIFLDDSSTIMNGLQMLRSKKDLTIVTTNLLIGMECTQLGFEVVLLGGKINPGNYNTYGALCHDDLSRFTFDLALLGTTGIKGSDSYMLNTLEEVSFHREVVKHSRKVLMLMHQEKMNETGNYPFLSFSEIPVLITNPLSKEDRNILNEVPKIIEV
ncbi:DeoR/GlpR family DNA-binding transcription regulator [Ileibacterium valens]|uniref:DeoR/GlpR family DNA-binding transcription regulator n=1 Tax=Ileibacterium valens TaxID=1862668 RepID=UPI00259B6565|nr:DeoR/GlpR family DNA-binding transcription regulator [Ileibacterium valens]